MKGHKWFAAIYDPVVAKRHEETHMKEIRPRIVSAARGRVLEIGAGTGNSLPYYRDRSFEELVISEPDPYMMERLRRKLGDLEPSVRLVEAPAEELPFPDGSFDTVISTSVLCTVPSLSQALEEIRRVLHPDGQLRFFEHVRAHHRLGAFIQDLIQPIWSRLGAGCRPNRDIAAAIQDAGFCLSEIERMHPRTSFALIKPHVFGVATLHPTESG